MTTIFGFKCLRENIAWTIATEASLYLTALDDLNVII